MTKYRIILLDPPEVGAQVSQRPPVLRAWSATIAQQQDQIRAHRRVGGEVAVAEGIRLALEIHEIHVDDLSQGAGLFRGALSVKMKPTFLSRRQQ